MNGWLDGLLGAIKVGTTLLTKRNVIRMGQGLTAVDDSANEETELQATGSYLASLAVGTLTGALQGWVLALNSGATAWEAVRGLTVVDSGTVTLTEETTVTVTCASYQEGDVVLYAMKTADGAAAGMPIFVDFIAATSFRVCGQTGNLSTYYYYVVRPGAIPPS